MSVRSPISQFELCNPLYKNAQIYFYEVANGLKTAVLANLYAGPSGLAQLPNPQKLNSQGKFKQPVYIQDQVIGSITGISVASHDTGIVSPAPIFLVVDNTTNPTLQYSYDGGITYFDAGAVSPSGSSALVGFLQAGAGAVETTAQTKLRERKSILDWCADALKTSVSTSTYSAQDRIDMYTACTAAWVSALANGHDIYAPAGLYQIGASNFPWRQSNASGGLLNCNGTTIYCDGPQTVFETVSVNGADVFQLNGLDNFNVLGWPKLTATISGAVSGSNGVSVTSGFDRMHLQVYGYHLPAVNRNGGKAVSVQSGTTANKCGSLKIDVIADGCVVGFGTDVDLVTEETKAQQIDVTYLARNCWTAFEYSGAGASGAISLNHNTGIMARGTGVDCQHDVLVQRAHGIRVDHVVNDTNTATAASKRLDPNGVAWSSGDTVVEALNAVYVKNAWITLTGNKGACDYKAQIGGATAGSSGLDGFTRDSTFNLDIGGTSATADINCVNAGGVTARNCTLNVSLASGTVDALFYTTLTQTRINQADVTLIGQIAGGESTAADTTLDNGTIPTAGLMVSRVAPAASRTGNILQAGTVPGQRCLVINQSASFTITFAAVGTSLVIGGAAVVIGTASAMDFSWNSAQSVWYPIA